ncbi:hypothetical protein TKK_0019275 [Trichogramma kaykai]|uniref:Uncharacterized protein n=1 Tax=Trichogramma kaykai TaxID=54128 RepID=A0ABD2VSY9_9HYME
MKLFLALLAFVAFAAAQDEELSTRFFFHSPRREPSVSNVIPGTNVNISNIIAGRMADENAGDSGDEELVRPNNQLNIERQGPYIPGVSEAVEFAKKQILAQLQTNKNFHTGIRDAVNQAINSPNPAQAIKTVQEQIKKYFQIEAQRNPFLLVGRLIVKQGQRLSQQVGQMFEQQRRQNQGHNQSGSGQNSASSQQTTTGSPSTTVPTQAA